MCDKYESTKKKKVYSTLVSSVHLFHHCDAQFPLEFTTSSQYGQELNWDTEIPTYWMVT